MKPLETLRNWVRQKPRGEPSVSDAIKIAGVMKLSLDELFCGKIPDDQIERIVRDAIDQVQEVVRDGSKA